MRARYSVSPGPRSRPRDALLLAAAVLFAAGAAPVRASTLEQWLGQREEAMVPAQGEDPLLAPIVAAEAIPGWAGQPTPLVVVVSQPPAQHESAAEPLTYVLVSQLPARARVSPGQDLGNGVWRVGLDELADLTVTTPADYAGTATLRVTAVSVDGEGRLARDSKQVDLSVRPPGSAAGTSTEQAARVVPAEALALRSVPPSAAKPDAVPAQKLMKRGDALFAQGDLAGARLFYEMAAAGGSGPAALALGRTHDPLVHRRLHVRGLSADADQAASWYRRALENGSGEAEGHLKELSAWIAGTAK